MEFVKANEGYARSWARIQNYQSRIIDGSTSMEGAKLRAEGMTLGGSYLSTRYAEGRQGQQDMSLGIGGWLTSHTAIMRLLRDREMCMWWDSRLQSRTYCSDPLARILSSWSWWLEIQLDLEWVLMLGIPFLCGHSQFQQARLCQSVREISC